MPFDWIKNFFQTPKVDIFPGREFAERIELRTEDEHGSIELRANDTITALVISTSYKKYKVDRILVQSSKYEEDGYPEEYYTFAFPRLLTRNNVIQLNSRNRPDDNNNIKVFLEVEGKLIQCSLSVKQ